MMARGRRRIGAVALVAVVLAALPAGGQEQPGERPDVWALRLGARYDAQPADFQQFACATKGGVPSTPLESFADYARCPAGATGLHAVQFRYDDEAEYWARAMGLRHLVARYEGTRIFTYPVVVAALFDDAGILRGYAVDSDDRAPTNIRQRAYTLPRYVRSEFGSEGWTCTDLPPAEGEEPMGRLLVKEDCRKVTAEGWTVITEARMLRRPGQSLVAGGQVRTGQFESVGRLRVYDVGVAVEAGSGDAD